MCSFAPLKLLKAQLDSFSIDLFLSAFTVIKILLTRAPRVTLHCVSSISMEAKHHLAEVLKHGGQRRSGAA